MTNTKKDFDADQPQYIEKNGVFYRKSVGCGSRQRAKEERGRTVIIECKSYWVYAEDTKATEQVKKYRAILKSKTATAEQKKEARFALKWHGVKP